MAIRLLRILLEPLMNERGQFSGMLGVSPPAPTIPGLSGSTGTAEETRTYGAPWLASGPSPDYGDLIRRYQVTLGGGTGSFQDLINLQRTEGLEAIRNAQAARGLSSRSGVGVSAASQFLRGFEPQAAAMQAEYFKSLLGDYAGAVSQGRSQFGAPQQTSATRKETSSSQSQQQQTGGGSQFQYIPSNPYASGGQGGAAPGGGGGGGGIPSLGGGSSGGFTSGYLGSPYIPGGMAAAGYSQLGDSGAYSKPLYGGGGGGIANNIPYGSYANKPTGISPYADLSSPYTTSTGASRLGNPWA